MRVVFFILLFIVFASCNSFDRMKYRHIEKVAAVPQEFSQPEKTLSVEKARQEPVAFEVAFEVYTNSDLVSVIPECNSRTTELLLEAPEDSVVLAAKIVSQATQETTPVGRIKRDYSLLVAIMFIAGGIFALALCIFYFPFAGISWLWIVAFEIFFLYAAWRMIGTGITFFITRFRRKENYRED